MAANVPVIVIEYFRVEHGEGFSMPVVSLCDRRAAGNRLVRWVFQRHLETVLYGRSEGSSGPIWKVMNIAGIGSTTLAVNKASMTAGLITEAEYAALMTAFKSSLPDMVDPSSLGRIRNCTIIPLAAAATVVRTFGRSPASMAWLRSLSQPVPHTWELREEQEANEAAGEVDLILNEQLDEQNFEAEEMSFAQELLTMPAFSTDKEDEDRLKTYILQRVPPMLKSELDAYSLLYRTETFAARRQGGAVQSVSAEADSTSLLRFFGWQVATNRPLLGDSITFLLRDDLGDITQEYAQWLQATQRCKFSTIANYINGLVSITSYCYANLAPDDALLSMEPNPLSQLINLRAQAEKASKTQQMYEKRVGGWIEWDGVQTARVSAMAKLDDLAAGSTPAARRNLLRDCCALSLLSLIPPDRVGCIRKLRLGHTLKKKESGGWAVDLSKQRDGHKTSRFYGPFAASLPVELTPILDKYTQLFAYDMDGDSAYLFHPPQSGFDRPMESSSWSQWVSRLFQRHAGVAIAPKTLRSIFITWLRNNTSAPEILKSAAHAQKHSEVRQASDDYDQLADDRLVAAAYDFNIKFASTFTAESVASGGEGSSSANPAPPVEQPSPEPAFFELQPPGMPPPNIDSNILPPVALAVFNAQLADVGFSRSKAKGNGDCFPLSAMAGFEISVPAAQQPRVATTATVRATREGSVDILAGDAAVDGVDALVFRAGEGLPGDGAAARSEMAPWLEPGFWYADDGGKKSASFMLGVALHLERPVAVIERKGKTYLDPARAYGARDADGALLHTLSRPDLPETVPTYKLVPIAELLETLRINPTSCSVVEFNGSNHFDPWTINASLRAVVETAADAPKMGEDDAVDDGDNDDGEHGDVDGNDEGNDGDRQSAEEEAGEESAAAVGDWAPVPGSPFIAKLMKPSRQPAHGQWRKYYVTLRNGPPLSPGGFVKFPFVPGADGAIICKVPTNVSSENKEVIFTLHLSTEGATENTVTINAASFRMRSPDPEAPAEGDDVASSDASAPVSRLPPLVAFDFPDEPQPEAPEVEEPAAGAPPAPPLRPPSSAKRIRKERKFFGFSGELDGPGLSFATTPPEPKRLAVSLADETGVPDYAMPGNEVWARGWHAGAHGWFKARVLKLRSGFPRIVVHYFEDDQGSTNRLALPELDAYLHAGDIMSRDW